MFPSRTRVKDFIIKYEESHRLLKSEFLRPVFQPSKLYSVLFGLAVWSPISPLVPIYIMLEKHHLTKDIGVRTTKERVNRLTHSITEDGLSIQTN